MSGPALPRIINAAGHLSALGGAISPHDLAEAVAEAIAAAMVRPVDVQWLKEEASKRIAEATGAEAGCVTTGAAAGIALSVAACVAGEDLGGLRALPGAGGPAPIVLQAGHDIDFGAPVTQMVRLGGGEPVLAGERNRVTIEDLSAALPGARAFLFVQSHHVSAPARLSLEACVSAARGAGVPVIVDAAAEEDLRRYIAAGADLVTYSGGKALGGLSSSGFVAGSSRLVRAVRAQERGIGRAMKVGPEQILSVCIALELYQPGHGDIRPLLGEMAAALGNACDAKIVDDEAGRPILRLEIRTPRAPEIVALLREHDPPIVVRAHHAREGRFAIDPRNLLAEDVPVVIAALRSALGG